MNTNKRWGAYVAERTDTTDAPPPPWETVLDFLGGVLRPGATGVLRPGAAPRSTPGAPGWSVAGRAGDDNTGWYLCTGGTGQFWMLVGHEAPDPDQRLFDLTEPAQVIGTRLLAYADQIGVAYRATPGASGSAAIRALSARHRPATRIVASEPRWRWDDARDELGGAVDLRWRRGAAADESVSMVQAYDVRGMYLAAAQTVQLGFGAPIRVARGSWNLNASGHRPPGYWRITVPAGYDPDEAAAPAVVARTRIDREGTAWVTTPVVDYLITRGVTPYVHDAWLSAEEGRILRPWAERIRDAIYAPHGGDRRLADTYKATYAEAIGLLGRKGGLVYRPDWRDTIIDHARVGLIRKLDNTFRHAGMWPLRVDVDCVWYPINDATRHEVEEGLRVDQHGVQLGRFRKVGPPVGGAQYLAEAAVAR